MQVCKKQSKSIFVCHWWVSKMDLAFFLPEGKSGFCTKTKSDGIGTFRTQKFLRSGIKTREVFFMKLRAILVLESYLLAKNLQCIPLFRYFH